MDYHDRDKVERFKYITGNFPYKMANFVMGNIQGQEQKVVIPSSLDELKIIKSKKLYCAGAGSLLKQKEVY